MEESIVINAITNVLSYYNDVIKIFFGGIFFLTAFLGKFFHRKNKKLKSEIALKDELLVQQKMYYTMLLEKEENTKRFRHDIKGHISSMQILLEEKDYEHLEEYIDTMDETLKKLQVQTQTGNHVVNAIVANMQNQYENVSIQWLGLLGEELKIRSIDLCIIFYNLLSNAFRSADKSDEPVVYVDVKTAEPNIMVTVRNMIQEKVQVENKCRVRKVYKEGHGYGLKNIKDCVDAYKGVFEIQCKGQEFIAEVFLPNIL